MIESLKILDLLNKWGYLTAEQIALLLKNRLKVQKLI